MYDIGCVECGDILTPDGETCTRCTLTESYRQARADATRAWEHAHRSTRLARHAAAEIKAGHWLSKQRTLDLSISLRYIVLHRAEAKLHSARARIIANTLRTLDASRCCCEPGAAHELCAKPVNHPGGHRYV